MIIPKHNKQKRDEKVLWVRDHCIATRQDRASLYQKRKQWFMHGKPGNDNIIYNRLMAHVDLVSSFLYAADNCRFSMSAGRNSPPETVQQVLAIQADWNDRFRDTGICYQYSVALLWSLVFDTTIIKLGWNDARGQLFGRLITPNAFGVFDESEPDLDSQEAFIHTYRVHWDQAVLRLARAGLIDKVKDLNCSSGPIQDDLPAVMANMIITNTGGSTLSGPIMGAVMPNYEPQATYEPRSEIPMVEFDEVWVWDDTTEDYAIFTVASPDIILSDSRETIEAMAASDSPRTREQYKSESNIFMPEEHPFCQITPYPLYNYFWGESHCERLIPLQRWTNERLDQIHDILDRQVDPAKVFSGFMGLSDEKAAALGGPNSWVLDPLPGAKVEELKPEMPPDLFQEFKEIGHIFLEASGLTETTTGKGGENIRSGKQAKQAATTGAGRIKKVAVGLEPSLVRLGDLGIKLTMKNDDTHLLPDAGGAEFVAAQLSANKWNLRVSGHSHSPLFQDESKENAIILMKFGAIDKEMFIRLLHPENEDNIIHSLRERMKMEQMQAASGQTPPPQKGGKAAGGL